MLAKARRFECPPTLPVFGPGAVSRGARVVLSFSEVVSYPCVNNRSWLVVIETEITIGFETPFPVDPEDAEKVARLNALFWSGCNIENAASSSCAPR